MIGKLFKWMLMGGAGLVIVILALAWYIGAWNLLVPNKNHDIEPPALPTDLEQPAILVFSKTNGFRHKDGIPAGEYALRGVALKHGWGYFVTENGAVFNDEDLARFAAVVFNNASGDMLSRQQELALQRWLEAGGGWLGIHAAGDGSHKDWPWYVENLIGANFTAHIMGPQFQRAEVITENHAHPVNEGIDNVWQHEEEWYSWEESSRAGGMNVLATVNEESYMPVQKILGSEVDLSMGDHPITWSNCIGAGRSVYTAVGHRAEAFDVPQVKRLLDNALRWLVGETQGGCP